MKYYIFDCLVIFINALQPSCPRRYYNMYTAFLLVLFKVHISIPIVTQLQWLAVNRPLGDGGNVEGFSPQLKLSKLKTMQINNHQIKDCPINYSVLVGSTDNIITLTELWQSLTVVHWRVFPT